MLTGYNSENYKTEFNQLGVILMVSRLDLSGQRFGKLTALRFDGDNRWLCKCDCGNSVRVITSNLRKGNSKSCGCARDAALFKHGMGKTQIYRVWMAMRARCNNPNDQAYANYGGRGIRVCDRWNASFADFLADMGMRPKGFQIDRIDNDKGYEPGNCHWVSQKENLNNKRTSRRVEWNGLNLTIAQWAERTSIHPRTIHNRIFRSGWSVERALSTPTPKGAS